MHADAREYCRSCDICQRTVKPSRQDEMPLVPKITLHTFEKWTVDFVRPINPPRKRTVARYIIALTDYLTRWVEVVPTKDCSTMF